MRLSISVSALAITCSLALASGPAIAGKAFAPTSATRQVPTQLPTDVRPVHYTISATPDAARLRFDANVRIDIKILKATDSITLNAADLSFGTVTVTSAKGQAISALQTTVDAEKQTATYTFSRKLKPGRYWLDIEYTGKINTQASGLFALDYESTEGPERALFTQFEAPDARRFFPGWDEPNFRTPYDLRVSVPTGQTAVSNMPQAKSEARPDGGSVITFQTTPSMSSYLLFLSVGEFDRITTKVDGTEIGVVAKKGSGENGRFALEGSAQIVPYYNKYFGTPYPLPKLDNVAGPGNSQFFGAMENWGAIFSFESTLLVDPAVATEFIKQNIFMVAAHEIAHQWFGNLVTMKWWNDLWLNEGFASWMATKATHTLHPEWGANLDRINGFGGRNREAAMALDSVATTHPIVQPINTVEQISDAFDSIAYFKGEAVLTMLEDYVGEDAWQRGVQDYITSYRLGNTVTDNLWEKIEKAAGKPVTSIAHQFTLQPGIPLIRVENATCNNGNSQVTLRQAEFTRDRPDKQPLSWQVPVTVSTLGGEQARTLVSNGSAAFTVPGCGPLIVNSGQAGYYRTYYAPALLDRLTENYAALSPIDQLGLLLDSWALGLAGYQSSAETLDLIDATPATANPKILVSMAGIIGQIYGMYGDDLQHQALIARYASARLSPILNQIGWDTKANEASNIGILRSTLISTLGAMGDKDVVAEANRRYASNDPSATSGPLRTTILGVVTANLDAAGWEQLRARAKAEKNNLVRTILYQQLGSARDENLVKRALELALTDEPGATDSSQIISAASFGHPDLAFDFALLNREKVESLVDISLRFRYIPGLGQGSAKPEMIAKLQDYAQRYMTPESRGPADRAIEAIKNRIKVRETRLPDISRWLEARVK